MDKKNLPIDLLICGGVALIASFFPYATISIPKELAAFSSLVPNIKSPNAWGFPATWNFLPQILPILAIIAIAVFAILKSQNVWKAPSGLLLGLVIYALAHMVLTNLSLLANDNIGPGLGSILVLLGAGYVFYLVVVAKKPDGLLIKPVSIPQPKAAAPSEEEPKSEE